MKNEPLSIKSYLKDNPYSGNCKMEEKIFWGTETEPGIYFDYHKSSNRSIIISSGLSERNDLYTKNNSDCDNWIDENFGKRIITKLYVIQGFAGCGKSIFVHNIMKNNPDDFYYINIPQITTFHNENTVIFTEILNFFQQKILSIPQAEQGEQEKNLKNILKQLNDFSKYDLNGFNNSLLKIISQISEFESTNPGKWGNQLRNYLDSEFNEKNNTDNRFHNKGDIETILAFIIIFMHAKALVNNTKLPHTIIFDNLDIITDPSITSDCIRSFWSLMSRYNDFCRSSNADFPKIRIIIATRKILFSQISSYLIELEQTIGLDNSYVSVCDISNLYGSRNIVLHRISYWKKQCENNEIIEQLKQVEKIINVTEDEEPGGVVGSAFHEPIKRINLDAFFNHNYRALTNILSRLIGDKKYNYIIEKSIPNEDWSKVATIIFSLTLIFRNINDNNIWGRMGFGCNCYGSVDLPTTLNRLLLNYLYNVRCGIFKDNIDGKINETRGSVKLSNLVSVLNKMVFFKSEEKKCSEPLYNLFQNNTQNLIIERLSEMCARNPYDSIPFGYDSDEEELWRRPIYYLSGVKIDHTAASASSLIECFTKAQNEGNGGSILLSITDEGCILIKNIVNHFEFYSARYCGESDSDIQKPLYQAESEDELSELIFPVYNAIQNCCENNVFFFKKYTEIYNLKKTDEYLNQPFHPRVNIKGSDYTEPRAQLHIIRTIYAHIGYFNSVKEYFANIYKKEKEEKYLNMCRILNNFIGEYLSLYYKFFWEIISFSNIGNDNNVYLVLKQKFEEQNKEYKNNTNKNIRIQS